MTIKERIKELCKNKNISLNKLEQELDFAKGYISKLDKSTPNAKKMQLIADYFKVSVDYLMTGKESEFTIEMAKTDVALSNMPDRMKKYALLMADLSSDKQEHVIQLINILNEKE